MSVFTETEKSHGAMVVAQEEAVKHTEKWETSRRKVWDVLGPNPFNFWGLNFGGFTLLTAGGAMGLFLLAALLIQHVFALIGFAAVIVAFLWLATRIVDKDIEIKRWFSRHRRGMVP